MVAPARTAGAIFHNERIIMANRVGLYVLVAAFGATIGLLTGAWIVANPDSPMDETGCTSIVIDYPNGDWCELRGPGRFRLLDEWEDCDEDSGEFNQDTSALYCTL